MKKTLPKIGLGTTVFWNDNPDAEAAMATALKQKKVRMIDCAEMYGQGRSERTVGRILRKTGRDGIYIVDKILPSNVIKGKFRKSFESSCQRLGTSYIDLYLLHWRGSADLAYITEAMEQLKAEGRIGEWGVSNFDTEDMEDLFHVPYGKQCFCNQIMYNLFERGAEYDLLPMMKEYGVHAMAYSSLGSSYSSARFQIQNNNEVKRICEKENITISALLLAFVLHQNVSAVFSTSSLQHLNEDLQGAYINIDPYMDELNALFPSPDHKVPLAKL